MIVNDNIFEKIDNRIKELNERIDKIEGNSKHDELRESYITGQRDELQDFRKWLESNWEPEW